MLLPRRRKRARGWPYGDLPDAAHHMDRLTAPPALHAFERYVKAKRALLDLLQRTAEGDQQMLLSMADAASQRSGGPTG